jgi:hypothetical protein
MGRQAALTYGQQDLRTIALPLFYYFRWGLGLSGSVGCAGAAAGFAAVCRLGGPDEREGGHVIWIEGFAGELAHGS